MLRGYIGSALVFGDDSTPPLERGGVVVSDQGTILAIGTEAELRARFPGLALEGHRAVLTPGLVNAHTHLELSALRGKVPGGRGFAAWLERLFVERQRAAPESDFEAIDEGVGALLRSGTVAVGEVTNSLAALPSLGTAPLFCRVFHEVFGLQRQAAEATLLAARKARSELPALPSNLSYVLSPHTPYSMHPDLLDEVLEAARARGTRVSIHLSEHAAERAFMVEGGGPLAELLSRLGRGEDWVPPGVASIPHMAARGYLTPDVVLVHLADARAEEIATVAAAGSPVVLCPRSNLHIEVRLPPLVEILKAGIKPGLGTDSLSSSPSLDVLAEAKALHVRFPSVPARTLLAMTMSYGAAVLGLEQCVGRIAEGLSPGIVAFPHTGAAPADPERFVLQNEAQPREVLCRPQCHMEAPA